VHFDPLATALIFGYWLIIVSAVLIAIRHGFRRMRRRAQLRRHPWRWWLRW
jgi:hypothetical protein